MIKQTIILIAILISQTTFAQTDFDCIEIRKQIITTRDLIDSLRMSDNYGELYSDKIDTLNNDLINYLRILTINNRFQTCNVNLNYDFFSLLSSDKNFCITSWDTRQGGTMIDYTTTVIFKTKQKADIKTLQYGGDGYAEDNTKILFDSLITLHNTKGQAIYLAYGFGRYSSVLPYRVLKAFMISDNLVEDFNLFPNGKSELWLEYDNHHFNTNDKVLNIDFIDGARQLKIPIIENGRPTGNFYKLTFNGTVYK